MIEIILLFVYYVRFLNIIYLIWYMIDNYVVVMNIEYGILVFVNRILDDCC